MYRVVVVHTPTPPSQLWTHVFHEFEWFTRLHPYNNIFLTTPFFLLPLFPPALFSLFSPFSLFSLFSLVSLVSPPFTPSRK